MVLLDEGRCRDRSVESCTGVISTLMVREGRIGVVLCDQVSPMMIHHNSIYGTCHSWDGVCES